LPAVYSFGSRLVGLCPVCAASLGAIRSASSVLALLEQSPFKDASDSPRSQTLRLPSKSFASWFIVSMEHLGRISRMELT
jgi:hypothetical protein